MGSSVNRRVLRPITRLASPVLSERSTEQIVVLTEELVVPLKLVLIATDEGLEHTSDSFTLYKVYFGNATFSRLRRRVLEPATSSERDIFRETENQRFERRLCCGALALS